MGSSKERGPHVRPRGSCSQDNVRMQALRSRENVFDSTGLDVVRYVSVWVWSEDREEPEANDSGDDCGKLVSSSPS